MSKCGNTINVDNADLSILHNQQNKKKQQCGNIPIDKIWEYNNVKISEQSKYGIEPPNPMSEFDTCPKKTIAYFSIFKGDAIFQ